MSFSKIMPTALAMALGSLKICDEYPPAAALKSATEIAFTVAIWTFLLWVNFYKFAEQSVGLSRRCCDRNRHLRAVQAAIVDNQGGHIHASHIGAEGGS